MGFKTIALRLPTGYNEDQLKASIGRELRIRDFTFTIDQKSLDARNKRNIFWQLSVLVNSPELKGEAVSEPERLIIPYKKREVPVVVAGSGPAGFFAALALQLAGFNVTLIERGSEVTTRARAIATFEKTGNFDAQNNYAFGEGGAGTFSDGKLTSRSKHISQERRFVLEKYVEAGAPQEILYMAHPHLGTDNLRRIVAHLRDQFRKAGGTFLFETMLQDIIVRNSEVKEVVTNKGILSAAALFLAPGHSAFETYRMLMRRGVMFRTKNFALGSRMEHRQEIINMAQWGRNSLQGVKAAEYRLTSPADGNHQVFTFCMCPGGVVVPAAAYPQTSIVNGMSYYSRNGRFANAACVAGIHPDELAGKTITAADALDLLEQMERSFYQATGSYSAVACSISDFINARSRTTSFESSYPLGLQAAPLWELLPAGVVKAIQAGLNDFMRKMRGFETGSLIGLESKTSSPIQVVREKNGLCAGFDNLYMMGEGSGFAGGIISSAADGLRAAIGYVLSKTSK